jgi:hypothetical protein
LGIEIELRIKAGPPIELRIIDRSYALPQVVALPHPRRL